MIIIVFDAPPKIADKLVTPPANPIDNPTVPKAEKVSNMTLIKFTVGSGVINHSRSKIVIKKIAKNT